MAGGIIVDAVVVITLLLALRAGVIRGFVRTVFGAVGLVGGALLAVWLIPGLLDRYLTSENAGAGPFLLVGGTLLAAGVGHALLDGLTAPLTSAIRGSWARWVDAVLGAVLQAGVAILALWLAVGLVTLLPGGAVRSAVNDSAAAALIDRAVPADHVDVLQRALEAIDNSPFPRVFTDGDAPDLEDVEPPGGSDHDSAEVAAVRDSVLPVDAVALQCGRLQEGSGWVVRPDLVVTNAHVVAGAERITLEVDGTPREARLAAFDPDRDLALLHVPGLGVEPLQRAEGVGPGSPLVLAGYPRGGPYTATSGRVALHLKARGEDIYGQDMVTRDIFAVRAQVSPGNSGGPALTPEGRVAGVVFARSSEDARTAYVLTLAELDEFLAARPAPPGEGVTACA